MRSAELAHALDGLYDAAVTPDRWPDVLHQFARATGSVGCLFYPQHAERTGLVFPASPDMRGFLTDFVQEGWWLADHRANRGWPLLEGGAAVLVEHDVASDVERRTLPYYGELLARHDLPWWPGIGFTSDGQRWAMPILRSARQSSTSHRSASALAATMRPARYRCNRKRRAWVDAKIRLPRVCRYRCVSVGFRFFRWRYCRGFAGQKLRTNITIESFA